VSVKITGPDMVEPGVAPTDSPLQEATPVQVASEETKLYVKFENDGGRAPGPSVYVAFSPLLKSRVNSKVEFGKLIL
jgi:hypothetical protein